MLLHPGASEQRMNCLMISAALEMFAEDLEDVAVSKAREQEPRSMLAEVEAELRNLGKL